MSQDETVFIQQLGLGMWLWSACCPVFRCGYVHHIQRHGHMHNGVQGQATFTKRVKGAIIRWGQCTCGWQVCQRSEKCGHPVHPGIKVVGWSRVHDHMHNSIQRCSQRSKRSIQTQLVCGGCDHISSSVPSCCYVSKVFASPTTEMGRQLSPLIMIKGV